MPYRCPTCGKLHDGLPDISDGYPFVYREMSEEDRKRRARLTPDTCVIDDTDFFIRGVLEIPIREQEKPFGFGVWISQSRENFLKYESDPNSTEIGPFFGWLCTDILYYQVETLALKAMAHFPGRRQVPFIELEPTDHPLAIDQREGITIDKAWEIVHWYESRGIKLGDTSRKRPWWKFWT